MSKAVNDPAAAAANLSGGIPVQDVNVDVTKLNALSPEVISRQATVSHSLLPVSGERED
jgi:translation initiation factor 2 subunit 3